MITKIIYLNGYRIQRMGIGYAIQLMSALSVSDISTAAKLLSQFVSPAPSAEMLRGDLLKTIVDFSFKIPGRKSKNETVKIDYDEIASNVIHQLAAVYGWTIDYILEHVDFFQAFELIDRINASRASEYMSLGIIAHSPQNLYKIIDPLLYASGAAPRVVNIFELRDRRRGGEHVN